MNSILGWIIGIAIVMTRWTCRWTVHNDLRHAPSMKGVPRIYAAMHAHHAAALMSAESGCCAMVSRSADGNIIIPSLKLCGVVPIRGSAGNASKGGMSALRQAIKHLRYGNPASACIAVDGPKGPRGKVQPGVSRLAEKTGAAIFPAVFVTNRRWILQRTWDRLQVPLPFSNISVFFADPVFRAEHESESEFRNRIAAKIRQMEIEHDPLEAKRAGSVADELPEPTKVLSKDELRKVA